MNQRSRVRLERVEELTLAPFVRAASVLDASIYWIAVSEFPMLSRPREWLGEFHRRLALLLGKDGLREEIFLQFKTLYPNLIDQFTRTSSQYMPMTGMSLQPGKAPTPLPDLEVVRRQVEDAQKRGTGVDTTKWMPDYLHWFARKRPADQRADFLGYGGMLTLYLKPDEATQAPVVEMPGFVKSLSVYDPKMQEDIQAAYSLRDAFLAESKKVFGKAFENDPAYKGMTFILPLLDGEILLEATEEERSKWFGVFDGYFIESRTDRGMLLALKCPDFDETLDGLLRGMREDGYDYRS